MRWVVVAVLSCLGCACEESSAIPQPLLTLDSRAADRPGPCAFPPTTDGPALGPIVNGTSESVMAPVFSGGHAFFPLRWAPEARDGHTYPLELSIDAPARVRAGATFSVELTMTNLTAVTRRFLLPVDGSAELMHEPHYDLLLIEDRTGATPHGFRFEGSRCGTLNGIAEEDVVALSPYASSRDFLGPWGHHLDRVRIDRSGRYLLWVEYRNCSIPFVGRWPVETGSFTSNAVLIDVHSPE